MTVMPFDAARYLDSEETIAELLSQVLADGDPALIASALSAIARARGLAEPDTGPEPTFADTLAIIKSLGLELVARPAA